MIGFDKSEEWVVQGDMAEHLQHGLDLIDEKVGEGKLWLEEGVKIPTKPVPVEGTFDAAWYGKYLRENSTTILEWQLHIMDLKYGRGALVEAHDNKQLKIYGTGKMQELIRSGHPVDKVYLWIFQPRAMHGDGTPFRKIVLTPHELTNFRLELVGKVKDVTQPNAPLTAGPWCLYCMAHATCPEAERANLRIIRNKFRKDDRDRVGEIMLLLPRVGQWMTAVKELGRFMGENGDPPTGFKMVPGRRFRLWHGGGKSEILKQKQIDYLIDKLHDDFGLEPEDIAPPKLRTVAQIERRIPKAKRDKLKKYYRVNNGPDTMAPEADNRYGVTASLYFDAEDEKEEE